VRKEQLDDDVGPILREVKAGECPEWKDIADHSSTCKGYGAQWNSLVMRDGVLEHHWESANRRSRAAQIVLPQRKLKEILGELHEGSSGRHLCVNKTIDKVRQWY
jgi:hypothetical protein